MSAVQPPPPPTPTPAPALPPPVPTPGILGAAEIKHEIAQQRLVIGGDPDQVRGCSYDLRIGTIFWENKIYSGNDRPVVVAPGGVVALMTLEELSLPNDICGTAFAINQLSSRGFLVLNPGHVDPGFKGVLTVKALNVRKVDMTLPLGSPIFTVIFQRLPAPTTPFEHNAKNKETRLREFYGNTVEFSPRTFFEVMKAEKDGPFPSRDEVDKMIRSHRTTQITMALAVVTLVLAAVAAYKAIYPSAPVEEGRKTVVTPALASPALAPPQTVSQTVVFPQAPAKTEQADRARDGK